MSKYVRFEVGGHTGYGIVEGNTIKKLDGSYFDAFSVTSEALDVANVRLLSPCVPSKVVCVGLNYADHAKESNMELPDEPCLFMKPATSVIGPGEAVIYPDMSDRVDYEAELAVVVGKTTHNIGPEEADEYIFGYTCLNDVTARDLQKKDGQWTRAKSFDTFCPIGPWIVDSVGDPNNLSIELAVNDETRQRSNTNQLVFDVQRLLSLSHTRFDGVQLNDGEQRPGMGKAEPGPGAHQLIR